MDRRGSCWRRTAAAPEEARWARRGDGDEGSMAERGVADGLGGGGEAPDEEGHPVVAARGAGGGLTKKVRPDHSRFWSGGLGLSAGVAS